MKTSILYIILFFIGLCSHSQQVFQLSQYIFNDFLYNPALAGFSDNLEASFSFRRQWAGFTNAPLTSITSIRSSLDSNKYGIGGFIISEKLGLLNKNGINGSYSYCAKFDKNHKLYMGLSLELTQISMNNDDLIIIEENDKRINSKINSSSLIPDANIGIYFMGKNYYLGFSAIQLFGSNLNIIPITNESQYYHDNSCHYFLMGGYNRISLANDINMAPSFLITKAFGSPLCFDINAKFEYIKKYWFGLTYRTYDAIVVMVGLNFFDHWEFGYSYDITTSPISYYSQGTHELFLKYNVMGKK